MSARRKPDTSPRAIDTYQAELAAKFLARRCHCGAPAMSVIAGSEAVREAGILLQRAKPDRNLCMFHAGLSSREEAA